VSEFKQGKKLTAATNFEVAAGLLQVFRRLDLGKSLRFTALVDDKLKV
jgi:hypothetical protein